MRSIGVFKNGGRRPPMPPSPARGEGKAPAGYFFFWPISGCHAASLRLGAAGLVLILSFFGFLVSRVLRCCPLAMTSSPPGFRVRPRARSALQRSLAGYEIHPPELPKIAAAHTRRERCSATSTRGNCVSCADVVERTPGPCRWRGLKRRARAPRLQLKSRPALT